MRNFGKMTSDEMMGQILSRLPPKSLMRFKCIKKSWNTLIDNPNFVSKHLSVTIGNTLPVCILVMRLALRDSDTDDREVLFSMLNLCKDNDSNDDLVLSTAEDIDASFSICPDKKDIPTATADQFLVIKGHCNGIICLSDSNNIVLWNPAIREFRLLPQSGLLLPRTNSSTTIGLGIGFDPESKDYKVVHVVSYGEKTYDEGRLVIIPPKVEIYSLGTDSWQEIKIDDLETKTTLFWPNRFQIYHKGMCLFFGKEQKKEFINRYDKDEEEFIRQVIISFNTSDEVFHYILFPAGLYQQYLILQLIEWNESVALFCLHTGACVEYYELWLMNGFPGGEVSWTNHLTIEALVGIDRSLEFWKNDEILMVADDGSVVSYNLGTDELKNIPIDIGDPLDVETVMCIGSLVPIKRKGR